MPYRVMPLVTDEIYHVFNRGIARQPIFRNQRDYHRALETIDFYRFADPNMRFSYYNRLNLSLKNKFLDSLYFSKPQVEIFAFCLMPNHTHFLLRQTKERGITKFMRLWQDSYAKYFNVKTKRSGSVFEAMFKGVRIETEQQFIHVARYIHLNPLTSHFIKEVNFLEELPWSSFIDYVTKSDRQFVSRNLLQSYFPNPEKLKKFTFDQLDYQRTLERIKHLLHE